jgi:CheY-like chemotaxis protein
VPCSSDPEIELMSGIAMTRELAINERLTVRRHVKSELPFLRRFARAITGNSRYADLCVLETMDSIVASPTIMVDSVNPRVDLFRMMLRLLHGNIETDTQLFVSPLSRQLQLLMRVEGFSKTESARILGIEVHRVQGLLDDITKDSAIADSARVLIIEDEPLIAMQIECLVESLGHVVVGIATTRQQANRMFNTRRPDIVLSDVQLADRSSGLEAVRDCTATDALPVIFITAFPGRLLTGGWGEPTFLISKPFDADAVKATITQALYLKLRQAETLTAGLSVGAGYG